MLDFLPLTASFKDRNLIGFLRLLQADDSRVTIGLDNPLLSWSITLMLVLVSIDYATSKAEGYPKLGQNGRFIH